MRELVLRTIRKSFFGTCALLVAGDRLAKARWLRGDIGCESGCTHAGMTVEDSIRYIDRVFADYRAQAGLTRFHGRVAEIGPGDSCGVALKFLEDGCTGVDLVDRFWSGRNDDQQRRINRAIVGRSPGLRVRYGEGADDVFAGIRRHYGEQASAEAFFLEHRGYDFIVSRAVLEHVRDPLLSLQRQADALVDGGMMLHAVDLRDHGMFTGAGYPETKFLETPAWLHRAMTAHCGRPNRIPFRRYREALDRERFDVTFRVTSLVGCPKLDAPLAYEDISSGLRERALATIRAGRHRFASDLNGESDVDLSISGFFMVARKRAN
jgi:SAM-dependent methyltransferase